MAPSPKAQRFVNKWSARLIPLLLVGIVGYATYVVVVLIGVNYLLNPPNDAAPRTGAAVTIIVLHFLFMIPMVLAYARTLHIVVTDPGYVPQPSVPSKGRRSPSRRKKSRHNDTETDAPHSEKGGTTPSKLVGYLDRGAVYGGRRSPPPGLEQFYSRQVFECEIDGLPRWCSACRSWKPDRSHHSSEVGKCVYKLDHYCPWAGGIVSETSFKAFLLFCIYGALYCLFDLITTAFFTAEQHRLDGAFNIQFIIIIVLSGLFALFSSGMGLNTVRAVLVNSTTIDNLSRGTRIHHFCILLRSSATQTSPDDAARANHGSNNVTPLSMLRYPTITYPLPDQHVPAGQINPPLPRTFAILATPSGTNPYLLTSRIEDFKTVMGEHVWQWFLPFRKSPCCSHSQDDDRFGKLMYKLGPAIDKLMMEFGLLPQRTTDMENGDQRTERIIEISASKRAEEARRDIGAFQPLSALTQTQLTPAQHEPQGSVTLSRLEEGWMQTTRV